MGKIDILSKAGKVVSGVKFKAIKHSPEILLVVGIASGVAATIMACRETLYADQILEDTEYELEKIKTVKAQGNEDKYTPAMYRSDLVKVYGTAALNYAYLYSPAVITGAISITCILASYNIMKKRNIALAAGLAATLKEFKDYRNRVAEKYGTDAEKNIRYNVKTVKVEEKYEDENGKIKTKKTELDVADPNSYSIYAKVFDDGNPYWQDSWNRDANWDFANNWLILQQNILNDKLKADGYLFLSDVYKALGFKETKVSREVGWIYDENSNDSDNFIDFGIFDTSRAKNNDFINGYERAIILDFNVDGPIKTKFEEARDNVALSRRA